MSTSANSEIKKKVETAINTSGYPVELFVSKILTDNKHVKWNNQYFFDLEEKKARSVDIVVPAFNFHIEKIKSQIYFGSELIIECKKSLKTAWVFFETKTVVQPNYLGQSFDYESIMNGINPKGSNIWKFDDLLTLHYSSKGKVSFANIAQNFHSVRIGEKDLDDGTKQMKTKDMIFEAVNQVVKYIIYEIQDGRDRVIDHLTREGGYPLFRWYFPIIVYDGPIYNGFLKDDKIELEERDHIILETHFTTPYGTNPQTFLIDIVKKNYFEKLLSQLSKDQELIEKHLKKDEEKFVKHVKSLHFSNKSH